MACWRSRADIGRGTGARWPGTTRNCLCESSWIIGLRLLCIRLSDAGKEGGKAAFEDVALRSGSSKLILEALYLHAV